MPSLPKPQPAARPRPIPPPQDRSYAGTIELFVDATDTDHAILTVREAVPVSGPGPFTLIYPEWLPGFHSPEGQIELLAGLKITAGQDELEWRRDPVNVYAFHVVVPDGIDRLMVEFQHLSPTSADQGRVAFTAAILCLQWNTVILHPAGHFARQVQVAASVQLPGGWDYACAVPSAAGADGKVTLETTSLDVLVDSPLYAGAFCEQVEIDPRVRFNIFADRAGNDLPPERKENLKALVQQADLLFGARHFDHYEYLFCLSDQIGAIGVEHHRSCEIASKANLFSEWEANLASRSVLCHEYIHSWNGKYRRGADSWQPCFLEPIRNSLMWVYEGLTQYWGEVLSVRSCMVAPEAFRGSLALTTASLSLRPGHLWRPMRDTTRDPIIASRKPLPWPSWQRSEDYYSEGMLVWLDVDMMIREMTNDTKSLDDFAQAFFGMDDGGWVTNVYTFEDICQTLQEIAPFDWAGYFSDRLNTRTGPPMDAITKAGWGLAFESSPNIFHKARTKSAGLQDHQFSTGMIATTAGKLSEVIWQSPAFRAGLRGGDLLIAINGEKFDAGALGETLARAQDAVTVTYSRQGRVRDAALPSLTPNFPVLVRSEGRDRLEDLLRPK
jgi:predicted metalloprotease with PDZ domain